MASMLVNKFGMRSDVQVRASARRLLRRPMHARMRLLGRRTKGWRATLQS